ncbi:hypothetical protein GQX73_g2078 [Xylaria multiplex]|uniref:DnaJ homologue subfamily C member 28 conserved domain-containing protein n=1 Tax=Xylaria multiplex TaxID=323545 RepID=A0A7C8MYC8_9PEZI|nr:hypothetical protein GQX73_g2078 [Xylaria multiplex]
MASRTAHPYVCARCASKLAYQNYAWPAIPLRKSYATKSESTDKPSAITNETQNAPSNTIHSEPTPEPGAMSRRLQEATDEVLLTGGKAGRRAIKDAGFSEELKEKLLAKVKDAQFRSQYAAAFSEVDMPSSAGEGTRITATSQPWAGQETTEDSVLRMLTDTHKPLDRELRGRPKIPDPRPVDMRMRQQSKLNPGHRVANARDKASMYTSLGLKESGGGSDERERAARREEFRERFQPGARTLPNTLAGLASLANQRIEDAIARGQFKNIPRGKDAAGPTTRINNPFIDTTEYIMNNMIKRQDIVPPWIEKQQELVKAAHTFRSRLRNDWKRHAARTIASSGGSLEAQIERAQQFARAEKLHNPRKGDVDQIGTPIDSTSDAVAVGNGQQTSMSAEESHNKERSTIETKAPLLEPFRDPSWLKTEQSYLELSIKNLNTLARSYNLMAPELAKKPYFKLERELSNCYAEVAPLVADAIRDRATRPQKPLVEAVGDRPSSILDRFGNHGTKAKIHDSRAPHYGFKEMWRDLFSRQER